MRDGSTGKDMLEGEEIDAVNAERIMLVLMEKGITIGLAESISAGGVTNKMTSIPGSSRVLKGAVACYTRFAKEKLLGISSELLDKQGTVSSDVSRALADAARGVFEADIGFAITGNAGPTTDSDQTKVGDIYMAIAAEGEETSVKYMSLFGDRETIRAKSVTESLRMIREFVLERYL